ncbi:hypothetical protein I79_016324 [Cricetulus griseus]|uniref:Uncharacterized protein n=1 Tax=Cricetulus griseus TaxID=10029 RepID=G3HZ29_CRIGR|nr:hypothetical protein I79_016324 [Cricetulus griseus]
MPSAGVAAGEQACGVRGRRSIPEATGTGAAPPSCRHRVTASCAAGTQKTLGQAGGSARPCRASRERPPPSEVCRPCDLERKKRNGVSGGRRLRDHSQEPPSEPPRPFRLAAVVPGELCCPSH